MTTKHHHHLSLIKFKLFHTDKGVLKIKKPYLLAHLGKQCQKTIKSRSEHCSGGLLLPADLRSRLDWTNATTNVSPSRVSGTMHAIQKDAFLLQS